MIRDDNGIAVPGEESPLPWKTEKYERLTDRCGARVASVVDTDLDTLHFIAHAANYHARLADIVRRLAEWHVQETDDIGVIVADAAELWAEMTQEGGE